MLNWWKENWKAFLTMLFGFLLTLWTAYLQSKQTTIESKQQETVVKQDKIVAKQKEVAVKQEFIQEQTNAAQANAEVALYKLGVPATLPNYEEAAQRIQSKEAVK